MNNNKIPRKISNYIEIKQHIAKLLMIDQGVSEQVTRNIGGAIFLTETFL